jgi:hypothetical protein
VTEPTTTDATCHPSATNPNRPPLYRVTKGTPKGARVTLIAVHSDGRRAVVRHVDGGEPFTKRLDALERIYRTGEERELGRDFTDEEATANEKQWTLRMMILAEERRRTEIAESIERMAQALERCAITIRNELASPSSDMAVKVERVQHELAWLFPNLGAHSLTHAAVEWSSNQREVSRLLTEGIAPAGSQPA